MTVKQAKANAKASQTKKAVQTVKASANKATRKASPKANLAKTESKTLYFGECKTAEECKAKFVELADSLKGKSKSAMLTQFGTAFNKLKSTHATKDGKIYERETEETAEDFASLIIKLAKVKGVKVEMCGSWIWVSGETKPVKDTLKELGFWFSAKKSAWYNNGGASHKKSKNYTLDEIRSMWGSEAV